MVLGLIGNQKHEQVEDPLDQQVPKVYVPPLAGAQDMHSLAHQYPEQRYSKSSKTYSMS